MLFKIFIAIRAKMQIAISAKCIQNKNYFTEIPIKSSRHSQSEIRKSKQNCSYSKQIAFFHTFYIEFFVTLWKNQFTCFSSLIKERTEVSLCHKKLLTNFGRTCNMHRFFLQHIFAIKTLYDK